METILYYYRFSIIFLFKSYYVVWKPTKRASAVPAPTAFKSYYVVWKPKVGKEQQRGKKV